MAPKQAKSATRPRPRLEDYVRVYDAALSHTWCSSIVQRFEFDVVNRRQVDVQGIRRFAVLNVSASLGWRDVHDTLLKRMTAYERRYAEDCDARWLPRDQAYESFRIKRYRPGTGEEFKPHVDIANAVNARRFLVAFWYLNDVAAGGETEFTTLGLSIKPRSGRLLMFPPNFLYPHAGRAPASGPKYIVGSYLLYV